MRLFSLLLTISSVTFCVHYSSGQSRRKPHPEKRCRKSCERDSDCTFATMRCLYDEACGLSCLKPKCLRLRPIENGMVRSTSRIIGATAIYNCSSGYGLEGSARRTCGEDNRWNPTTAPTCESFAKCGKSWRKEKFGRVVAGVDAPLQTWRWQVLITHSSSSIEKSLRDCILGGGSVVNKNWILTAAHIFSSNYIPTNCSRQYVVFVGISGKPRIGERVQESVEAYSISEYHTHDGFTSSNFVNDIALIKVGNKLDSHLDPIVGHPSELTFGYNVGPICLPCNGSLDVGTVFPENATFEQNCLVEEQFLHSTNAEVIVTGFGHTEASGTGRIKFVPPIKLKQASLRIASMQTCRDGISNIRIASGYNGLKFEDSLICTEPGEADACVGDSGGPLMKKITNAETGEASWIQIGIVSFGYGCANSYPGYYTNVARFISWINKKINLTPTASVTERTSTTESSRRSPVAKSPTTPVTERTSTTEPSRRPLVTKPSAGRNVRITCPRYCRRGMTGVYVMDCHRLRNYRSKRICILCREISCRRFPLLPFE